VRAEVVAVLEEALRMLPESDSAVRAILLVKLAIEVYFEEEHLDRCRALHEEGLAMARRVGDPHALAYTLGFSPIVSPLVDTEAHTKRADEAIAIAHAANDARAIQDARLILMWSLVETGDMVRFDRELDAARELAERVRVPGYAWFVPLWRATREIMAGHLAQGEELALEAVTIGQGANDPAVMQMFGVQFYAIRIEQGRGMELEAGVRSLVEQFPAIPAWRTALALVLSELGRPDEARDELRVVLKDGVENVRGDGNWAIALGILADTWDSLDDDDPQQRVAYELLLPFRHRFVAIGWAADAYGSVERLLGVFAGRLGMWDAMADHFRAGIEADTRTGGLRMASRAHWQWAKALLRRGDTEGARETARRGLALAEQMELPLLTERLRVLSE
jgi:hypothetical protein